MKIRALTAEQAAEQGKSLPYAMITEYSRVVLGRTPDSLDWDELLEARFFDDTTEIRIYTADGEKRARSVTREADDTILEQEYQTEGENVGKIVRVRRYLRFDEDGQAGVATVCLCGWRD